VDTFGLIFTYNPIFHPKNPNLPVYQEVMGFNFGSSAPSCAKYGLKDLSSLEMMYPFKKAKLNDCNSALDKRWYIEFYAWDVQQSKLLRKRFYEINNYDTIKDRRNYARRIIGEINDLLDQGYHFDVNKASPEPENRSTASYNVEEAVEHALVLKKPSLRVSSYASYKSTVKIFTRWTAKSRISVTDIVYFDKLRAIHFDDYLIGQCGYSAKTVNGHIAYMKSLFQVLVEREIIATNPFKGVAKHKESASSRNLAFSENQIEKIKEIIEEKDPMLWMFIQFIYYCFLRPNEIRQLEHRFINLEEKKIYVPGNVSKNGKDGYVSIPDTFCGLLNESEYFNQEDRYVFQAKFKTIPVSKNVMGYRFRKLVKELNLGKDYTLYSWKHSGVVAAYNAGVDIKTIQNQCRHQSLEQTDIYLKSLGLGVSLAMNKIPKL
jgi:integrase